MTEAQIVWLDNPEKWGYVREATIMVGTRMRPISERQMKQRFGHFYKLVGYAILTPDAPSDSAGFFIRRIFWLKDYDRGCPNEKYHTGYPCEAVDPLTVAPNVLGKKTDRSIHRKV